jgi:proprotein convertase subtilisin/kexin type 5
MTNTSQCLVCNASIGQCLACVQTFLPSTGGYLLECLNCQPEYFVNGSICSPCNESLFFCLTCTNNYQCVVCQDGYYLSSTLKCIDCPSIIQGCTSCTSSSTCTACTEGYYLASSYCSLCLLAIPNCYTCTLAVNASLACGSCTTGFYLGTNLTCLNCTKSIQFCTGCTNSTHCTSCISGYLARSGVCVTCSTLLPNCLYCPNYACQQCAVNHLLDTLTR